MARITVEDCLKKIKNQYDLVLLAKERTSQLNSGAQPVVPEENDKRTVIALREIGESKVSISELEDSAINKLRENPEDATTPEDFDASEGDDFEKLYKGEVSKSGAAILPSKRARKVPEKQKIEVATENQEDQNELVLDKESIVEEEQSAKKEEASK